MDRATTFAVSFIILTILLIIVTIFLHDFITAEEKEITRVGSKIKVSVSTVEQTLTESNIFKIDVLGYFNPDNKVVINFPELVKESRDFSKIVKTYGIPQTEINVVALSSDEAGGYKPIIFAFVLKNGEPVYSTIGSEVISRKNGFWINFVEYTCLNEENEEVGITILGGVMCGKVEGEDKCFYKVSVFIHPPTISLGDLEEFEPPEVPEDFEID